MSHVYGPFADTDLPIIRQVLDRESATYEFVRGIELLERQREQMNEAEWLEVKAKAQGFNPAHFFLTLDDASLARLGVQLEHYGIIPLSEGKELDHEDYLCTICDYHQAEPGYCPKHNLELATFSDYNKLKEETSKKSPLNRGVKWLMFLLGASFAAYQLIGSFSK